MKVVTALEMFQIETQAYQDGVSDEKYMLNAGFGISKVLIKLIEDKKLPNRITIVAGKGNNAGD